MGAGGSNYAQNALATLFTEQYRNQGAIGPNDNPRNLQELADDMAYHKARQEGLTTNQEFETRNLINYLGLRWEDDCLFPHLNISISLLK